MSVLSHMKFYDFESDRILDFLQRSASVRTVKDCSEIGRTIQKMWNNTEALFSKCGIGVYCCEYSQNLTYNFKRSLASVRYDSQLFEIHECCSTSRNSAVHDVLI